MRDGEATRQAFIQVKPTGRRIGEAHTTGTGLASRDEHTYQSMCDTPTTCQSPSPHTHLRVGRARRGSGRAADERYSLHSHRHRQSDPSEGGCSRRTTAKAIVLPLHRHGTLDPSPRSLARAIGRGRVRLSVAWRRPHISQ